VHAFQLLISFTVIEISLAVVIYLMQLSDCNYKLPMAS